MAKKKQSDSLILKVGIGVSIVTVIFSLYYYGSRWYEMNQYLDTNPLFKDNPYAQHTLGFLLFYTFYVGGILISSIQLIGVLARMYKLIIVGICGFVFWMIAYKTVNFNPLIYETDIYPFNFIVGMLHPLFALFGMLLVYSFLTKESAEDKLRRIYDEL